MHFKQWDRGKELYKVTGSAKTAQHRTFFWIFIFDSNTQSHALEKFSCICASEWHSTIEQNS